MTASLFRSSVFWGGVAAVAITGGVMLHRRRAQLLGRTKAGPTPKLIKNNLARTKTPPPSAVRTEDGMTLSRYDSDVITIDQRLKWIQERVWDGIHDPRIRKLALKLTSECGRDDGECEARKIFDAAKARVRYTGDVGPVVNPKTGKVDAIDYYQRPWVTWDLGGGDCDDATGVVASLLAVIGHTVRLRVSAPSRWADFAHIYPVTLLPKDNPRNAKAVDITLPWKASVGSEAKYGRAQDYEIEVPA